MRSVSAFACPSLTRLSTSTPSWSDCSTRSGRRWRGARAHAGILPGSAGEIVAAGGPSASSSAMSARALIRSRCPSRNSRAPSMKPRDEPKLIIREPVEETHALRFDRSPDRRALVLGTLGAGDQDASPVHGVAHPGQVSGPLHPIDECGDGRGREVCAPRELTGRQRSALVEDVQTPAVAAVDSQHIDRRIVKDSLDIRERPHGDPDLAQQPVAFRLAILMRF